MNEKKGVLIVDLGMSEHPNLTYIQKNLANYLANRRVFQLEQVIWNEHTGLFFEFKNSKKIKACCIQGVEEESSVVSSHYEAVQIEVGMVTSGGCRAMEKELDRLVEKGVTELTIIPMFSQYIAGAVEQVLQQVTQYFIETNYTPSLKFIRTFANHPDYINYFVSKINQVLRSKEKKVDAIVFTYPVIPDFWKDEDSYYQQCEEMTQKIANRIRQVPCYQTYQPRLDMSASVECATPDILAELANKGEKNVLVVAPRLVIDCFEVAKQIEGINKQIFYCHGGHSFQSIFPFMEEEEMTALFAKLVE